MDITIFPPLAFSELGQRENNEDYSYPKTISTSTRLFIVCDGMGGLDKGEEASRITAEYVHRFFMENPSEAVAEDYVYQAVKSAFEELKAFANADSLITRMGSTLALLQLNANGATIAHVGDSRVYHIRDGVILYKTKDHRQVLDMVEQGIITDEEALGHPWRNRLSRSVSFKVAMSGEPSTAQPSRPVVQQIADVKPHDYFFICTDGVLEQVSDEILTGILNQNKPNEAKIAEILQRCRPDTRDNYTGVLVQVKTVSEGGIDNQLEQPNDLTSPSASSGGFMMSVVIFALLIGIVMLVYYWYFHC